MHQPIPEPTLRAAATPRVPLLQRGLSLIEVLIAVLVLSLGMLGIAALQATALRNTQSAYESSQAVLATYSIIESMRANRAAAVIGNYDLTSWTCDAPTAGNLAETDLANWIELLEANFGDSACGQIICDGDSCEVRVRWDDSRGTGGAVQRVVETRTLL